MKKIVIMPKDGERGRQLAQCLGTVFPECEIQVLADAQSEKSERTRKRKGGPSEKSKNTGRR